MGAFADSLFAVLMSWVRALVNSLWALFTTEKTTVLEFLGKNWLTIVIVLIAAGLAIDWITWMIRWKPYTLRGRMREAQRREEEKQASRRAQQMAREMQADALDDEEDKEDWLPERPVMDEQDARRAMERAQAVPDAELGAYPGMRYGEQAQQPAQDMGGTQRYAAVHQEGPGAAEVARRRAEIDAWQRMQQEERRQQVEQMRAAEQRRREEETRAQAQARAEEEAQREYQRQMAEYERQKAQYERDLVQYQQELAAYEAAMQRQETDAETAQEIAPETAPRTRARRRTATYSDMVTGDAVDALPTTPAWPRMEDAVQSAKKNTREQKAKNAGFMGKMSHLIEPEQQEIAGVQALPPRVDPHAAYKLAARPEETQKRRRQ